MADYELLYPGRFLKSAEFKGKDVTLTLASIKAEEIDGKVKAIVRFEQTKRELVLNRTNAEALKLMFGRDTDAWIGKRITFFPATIKDPFSDGDITAIRVRGSPDITKPAKATVQRGKKTIRVAVVPTGRSNGKANGNGHAAAKPQQAPPTGEPPDDVVLPGENREPGGDDDLDGLPEEDA